MNISVMPDVWLEPGYAPQPMAIPQPTVLTINGMYVATKNSIYMTHILPGDPPIVHAGSRASTLSSSTTTSGIAVVLIPGNLNCGATLSVSQDMIGSST